MPESELESDKILRSYLTISYVILTYVIYTLLYVTYNGILGFGRIGGVDGIGSESRPILNRVRIGLTILNRVLNSESDSESRPILNRAYDPIIRKIPYQAQFPIRL